MTLAICYANRQYHILADSGWVRSPIPIVRLYLAYARRRKEASTLLGEAVAHAGTAIVVKEGTDSIPPVPVAPAPIPAPSAPSSVSVFEFVEKRCQPHSGARIRFKEFYDRLREWLPATEKELWTKHRVKKNLQTAYSVANGTGNVLFVMGLRWK